MLVFGACKSAIYIYILIYILVDSRRYIYVQLYVVRQNKTKTLKEKYNKCNTLSTPWSTHYEINKLSTLRSTYYEINKLSTPWSTHYKINTLSTPRSLTYSYACRNIVNTIMTNRHRSLGKYTSHTFIRNGCKRVMCERCVGDNKTATYWPPAVLAIAGLLSRSPGLLNQGPWGPQALSLELVLTLASYLKTWIPTAWNSCRTGLYYCLLSTRFLWASHLHPTQPVYSQSYPLMSSTGCTCYLHRCISYLTARPCRRSVCNRSTNYEINKLSTPLSTHNNINKLWTPWSTSFEINKLSTPRSTRYEINKLSTRWSTCYEINKLSAPRPTRYEINKLSTP